MTARNVTSTGDKTSAKKTEKRARILAAARSLLKPRSLELPSVNAITRKAGIAKGTFYLYFETREELYLSLLLESYQTAAASIIGELMSAAADSRGRQIDLAAALGRGCLDFAARDPQAIYLSGIAAVILEGNVSDVLALEFKRGAAELVQELAGTVEKIGSKSQGKGRGKGQDLTFDEIARRLMLTLNTLVVLWQNAHPPRNIEKLLRKHSELAMFQPAFEDSLNHALRLIWA